MRLSGVLMHISSLPSNYGIGTLGKEAYRFVDFLKDSGQSYWQILPICPTSYGDSPYQSFSTFAGNPYFIDFDMLYENGYLIENDYKNIKWCDNESQVNYGIIYDKRYRVLKIAYQHFKQHLPIDYEKFCRDNKYWLDDYALYMSIKDSNGGKSWLEWDIDYKKRKKEILEGYEYQHKESIMFYKVLQYLFYKQWKKLKEYANTNGIKIIGDLPIYVALDSADVWANTNLFVLDEDCNPIEVAGCPPDGFTADGQLWGNPIYDWSIMKQDNYKWWISRIAQACTVYDVTRIDHFRGFDKYYCIPADAINARKGIWRDGVGMDLFKQVKKQLGKVSIIAEDLGFLTPSVKELLKNSGFPGMKILQFAFDPREESDYLPYNYDKNCIVYTGTHDNDTIMGWYGEIKKNDKKTAKYAKEYMALTKNEGYNWGMMRTAWGSNSDTAIVTMQDLLGLGSEARMNTPATCGENWKWRCKKEDINSSLSKKIKKYTKLYGRLLKE